MASEQTIEETNSSVAENNSEVLFTKLGEITFQIATLEMNLEQLYATRAELFKQLQNL